MPISRRTLLQRGGLLSIGAAISALMPAKLRATTSNASTAGLPSEQVFLSLLNSSFKLVSDGKSQVPPVWLTLVKVKTIQSPPKSAKVCKGFILKFLGGNYNELPQGVYTFTSTEKPSLPSFSLLMVPSEENSRAYISVIYELK